MQRAKAALVVGRDRDAGDDPLDLVLGEALRAEPLTGAGGDQLLRARAGGHPLGGDAEQAPRPALGADRGAVERVQLLGLDSRDRRRLVLGEPRLDVDLGAAGPLALADEIRDSLRQRLGAERRLAEHDLADRLVDASSKRDMCAPFWLGPSSTTHSNLAQNSCSLPFCLRRMTFSTPVTPTSDRLS